MEHQFLQPVCCHIKLEVSSLLLQQITVRGTYFLHLEMIQADGSIFAHRADWHRAADGTSILSGNQNDRRIGIQVGKLKPGSG